MGLFSVLRQYAKLVWSGVLIVATVLAFYEIRPILVANLPVMVDPASPLYADFTITDQGHLGISDVEVDCKPLKAQYADGDTLLCSRNAAILPAYKNRSIDSFGSFTARFTPLFQLIAFSNSHDRVIIVGDSEQCLYHFRHGEDHRTITSACPIQVDVPKTSVESRPSLTRADVLLTVRYRWMYLPLIRFAKQFRFLVYLNLTCTLNSPRRSYNI